MNKLWETNDSLEIQDKELADLKTARDMQKINEVLEVIDEQDSYVLTNRNNISIMSQSMQVIKKEQGGVLSRLHEYSFKLNVSNTFSATKHGCCSQIQTNTLCLTSMTQIRSYDHFLLSFLLSNLKGIKYLTLKSL